MADVSIVGAGPAGAWAAYSLARRGARVTLIDPSHPREKPCGGGVTGRALALVAGAIDVAALPACVIRQARFTDGRSGEDAVVHLTHAGLSADTGLVVASRAEFDGLLLAAARGAGAKIINARVTAIVEQRDGLLIETTDGSHAAARVIGADGANSLVRRKLARPFRRDELSIATGYFAHGTTSEEIVVEIVDDPPGYLWSFPRPTHLAIGICAQADAGVTAETLRARTRSWIREHNLAPDARLQPYSWPIPSLAPDDLDAMAITGSRWALAGDAAGLVDPITREGIFFALQSGEWAADALASGAADPWRRYRERVRDEIGSELARAARLKAGFFRPRFTRLMIDALRHSAGIRAVMADLVAGRQSYARLKWRLARTFEAGLAVRLFAGMRRRA